MSVLMLSLSSYAIEENTDSLTESSSEISNIDSELSSETSFESSQLVSESESSVITEPSDELSSESSAESLSESYVQSSEQSSNQSSELSSDESYEESSEVSIVSPFSALNNLDAVLPVDREDYRPIESQIESSEQMPESNSEISSESSLYLEDTSKAESNILNAPPVPSDEPVTSQLYASNTDNSFLIGIIFWSVIGVVVTAVLIIILHSKGNSEFNFSKKRYRK